MNIESVGKLVSDHPIATGVVVFGVGLVALYAFGFFGGGGSSDGGATAAYFNASAAQGISGDQLAAYKYAADAQTTAVKYAADASQANNSTWASVMQHHDDVTLAQAPFEVQATVATALAQFANLAPVVTQKKSSGFFGIGASQSQTTSPNPASVSALGVLQSWFGTMPAASVH